MTLIKKTQTGDLIDLEMFVEWLTFLKSNQNNNKPIIILANSNIYFKLNLLAENNSNNYKKMLDILKKGNIYLLFYPIEIITEVNADISEECHEIWKDVLVTGADFRNLNTRSAFVYTFYETLRRVYQTEKNRDIIKQMFETVVPNFNIEIDCFVDSVNNELIFYLKN